MYSRCSHGTRDGVGRSDALTGLVLGAHAVAAIALYVMLLHDSMHAARIRNAEPHGVGFSLAVTAAILIVLIVLSLSVRSRR